MIKRRRQQLNLRGKMKVTPRIHMKRKMIQMKFPMIKKEQIVIKAFKTKRHSLTKKLIKLVIQLYNYF
jgi:hypothetical protein